MRFDLDVLSMIGIIKSTHDVRNLTEGLLLKILGGLVFSFGHGNRYDFIWHTLLIQHTNNALHGCYPVTIYLENHGYDLKVRCVMRSWEWGVVCHKDALRTFIEAKAASNEFPCFPVSIWTCHKILIFFMTF